MKINYFTLVCVLFLLVSLASCNSENQIKDKRQILSDPRPKVIGAMKKVMREGQLYATISLDTIANKEHLYGIGPIEYLKGEIIIINGKCYSSSVLSDTTMKVIETFSLKAPFFGYANISEWSEQSIPDSISTLKQLENYIETTTKNYPQPFFFKLTAKVDSAKVHVVNLPDGTKVTSPEEAHEGLTHFSIKNKEVELLGFYSTQHQTIFTHHDTFMHVHLITNDKQQMGHLEEIKIKTGTAKFYLPKL